MIPAALYARVSTAEQTTANQLDDLRCLATARGWEPVLYEDVAVHQDPRDSGRLAGGMRIGRKLAEAAVHG